MGNICDCGDPQSMHRASKYGCRHVDCVCAKFSLDIQATKKAKAEADHGTVPETGEPDAVERMVERDHADLGGHVELAAGGIIREPLGVLGPLARDLDELERTDPQVAAAAEQLDDAASKILARAQLGIPAAEAQAERLAKAEQERDTARAETAGVRELLDLALVERDTVLADNQELTGTRDELTSGSLALKAELASARQEIDRLIAQQGDVRQAAEEKVRAALAGQPPHLATALAEALADKELAEGRLAEANQNITALRESLNGSAATASVALRDLAEVRTELDNLRMTRDRAESELAEARQVIEAIEEDRPVPTAAPSEIHAVVDSYTRWFCQPITGCGEQYEIQQDDDYCICGKELLAVTVTTAITL